ncbi:sortase [Candidatus Daviesbacteria bacterium]|nr:sortase [Candidatus Daviesbacteria bacterium]
MFKYPGFLTSLGIILIFFSFSIVGLTFYPMLLAELGYQTSALVKQSKKEVKPIDRQFGIVVPKIGANSRIIANVDPWKEWEYQQVLAKGIAHAKGTAYPGQPGNMFLFSHSSVNFYEAQRYNSIFYLLDKLNYGDKVFIYFKGEKYEYVVNGKKIVNPNDVQYLKSNTDEKILTLMTCTPPGTSLKRLLVFGELIE